MHGTGKLNCVGTGELSTDRVSSYHGKQVLRLKWGADNRPGMGAHSIVPSCTEKGWSIEHRLSQVLSSGIGLGSRELIRLVYITGPGNCCLGRGEVRMGMCC